MVSDTSAWPSLRAQTSQEPLLTALAAGSVSGAPTMPSAWPCGTPASVAAGSTVIAVLPPVSSIAEDQLRTGLSSCPA